MTNTFGFRHIRPLSRRAALCISVATLVTGLATATVNAQGLPEGVLNFIVPVAVGGGTDMTFRALAEASRPYLNRTIVVLNMPGAGGAIGLLNTLSKPANGLTMVTYSPDVFTLPIFSQVAFTAKDFKPVMLVNEDPACIVVSADSRFKTLEQFIAEAKASPGKISVGNSGFGNIWHMSASAFAKKAGVDLLQVPYKGAAETIQATLGGQIEAFVASPPEVAPQVQGGKMRILAVMADQRAKEFPDVPTLKEKGVDLSIGTWRGIGVPAATPDQAVKQLQDGFAKGMKEKAFIDFMGSRGLAIRYLNTDDMNAFVARVRPEFETLATEIAKTKN